MAACSTSDGSFSSIKLDPPARENPAIKRKVGVLFSDSYSFFNSSSISSMQEPDPNESSDTCFKFLQNVMPAPRPQSPQEFKEENCAPLILPDSEGFGETYVTQGKKPPDTPFKKGRRSIKKEPAFITTGTQLLGGMLGKCNSVKPLQDGKGSYTQAYVVTSGPQVIADVANQNLVIKGYLERHFLYKDNQWMKNSLKQYQKCLEHNIPVAQIYNAKTALEEGCFKQRYIPHACEKDLQTWRGSTIDGAQLLSDVQERLKRVKSFFDAAVRYQLELDLVPSNLRFEGEHDVVLIDFREEYVKDEPVAFHLAGSLKAWACGNPHILTYLTSSFKEIDPEFCKQLASYNICLS